VDVHVNIDLSPDSPEAKEGRTLALRLLTARLAAGRLEDASTYNAEVEDVLKGLGAGSSSVDALLTRVAFLVAGSIEIAWALRVMTVLDPEVGDYLRSADDPAVLAFIEQKLDELAGR
jgi:hypothetical protein